MTAGRSTVLVVEDEKLIRRFLSRRVLRQRVRKMDPRS